MTPRLRGTLLGAAAILSWGSLGALGALSAGMPPYFVLGICFAIATAMGAAACVIMDLRPAPLLSAETLLSAALIGSYHLVYFQAFHHAAAIPVSLINYLWPAFLIVIGNLFFRLGSGWRGYLGAALGFLGVAVLIGDGASFDAGDGLGYGLALLGAMLWASYSNLRRQARHEGIGAMVSICLLASLFCFAMALVFGEGRVDLTQRNIAILALLGIGPAGGAFFLWDYGMRHGDAALLGVLSYSAPVLSTVLMVALGLGTASWRMAAAVALITLGGIVVQRGGLRRGT